MPLRPRSSFVSADVVDALPSEVHALESREYTGGISVTTFAELLCAKAQRMSAVSTSERGSSSLLV